MQFFMITMGVLGLVALGGALANRHYHRKAAYGYGAVAAVGFGAFASMSLI